MIENATPTEPATFYDGQRYSAADSVGHLMHLVVSGMRRHIEPRMAAHGLTAAQWYPLWKLKTGAAHTAQALARQMEIDAGAMTRLVDRLEAKGLIARERSATDRRVMRLSLTPAGESVVAHIPQVLADVNNRVLAGFSEAEWQLLLSLLHRLLANTQPAAAPRAEA